MRGGIFFAKRKPPAVPAASIPAGQSREFFPALHIFCYFADNRSVITGKWRNQIHESNRHSQAHRRPRPGGDPQGDPQDPADPGGRPVTDNMDTMGAFLLFHAGSGKKRLVEWYIMAEVVNFKGDLILIGTLLGQSGIFRLIT